MTGRTITARAVIVRRIRAFGRRAVRAAVAVVRDGGSAGDAAFRAQHYPNGAVDICLSFHVEGEPVSQAFIDAIATLPRLPVARSFGLETLEWRFDAGCTAKAAAHEVVPRAAAESYDAYVHVFSQLYADSQGDLWSGRLAPRALYAASDSRPVGGPNAVIIGTDEFQDPRITLHLVARAIGVAGGMQDGRLGLDNVCTMPNRPAKCGEDRLIPVD